MRERLLRQSFRLHSQPPPRNLCVDGESVDSLGWCALVPPLFWVPLIRVGAYLSFQAGHGIDKINLLTPQVSLLLSERVGLSCPLGVLGLQVGQLEGQRVELFAQASQLLDLCMCVCLGGGGGAGDNCFPFICLFLLFFNVFICSG